MARVIVFGADLREIIAATDLRPGIRWGETSDVHALLAGGLSKSFTDWLIGARKTRFVVAEDTGRIIGHVIFEAGEKVAQFDWLSIKLHARRDVVSYGGFVVPEHRNRGLVGAMKGFAARYFAERGDANWRGEGRVLAKPIPIYRREFSSG